MPSPLYVVVHSAVTPGEGGGVTFSAPQVTSTWTAALAAARNTLTPAAGPDDAPWFHLAIPPRPRSFSVRHPAISQTVNVAVVPRPANLQGGFLFLAGTVTGSALDLTTIQAEASWDDAYAAARRWMVRHAAHTGQRIQCSGAVWQHLQRPARLRVASAAGRFTLKRLTETRHPKTPSFIRPRA